MIDQEEFYKKIINLLDNSKSQYKLFNHKAAFSYKELEVVQKETGFIGTEGKCLILKTESNFIACITIQGKKLNFQELEKILDEKKIRLAKSNELKDYFGAEPGCAYPFGFNESINIYIDPEIYNQDWFLFSPVFPTKTIQVRGRDLKKIFDKLGNKIIETSTIFI